MAVPPSLPLPLLASSLGYAGATGIVLFAVRSVHAAVFRGLAGSLNPLDFSILTLASACLAGYAVSSHDTIFTVTNGASAACNGLVALLALRARR